jgi:hypothetical protein
VPPKGIRKQVSTKVQGHLRRSSRRRSEQGDGDPAKWKVRYRKKAAGRLLDLLYVEGYGDPAKRKVGCRKKAAGRLLALPYVEGCKNARASKRCRNEGDGNPTKFRASEVRKGVSLEDVITLQRFAKVCHWRYRNAVLSGVGEVRAGRWLDLLSSEPQRFAKGCL